MLGFVVCFWLWSKFLYSPRLVILPPLPPAEIFFLEVRRLLGPWPAVLIPLAGLVFVAWDGLTLRRNDRFHWWVRRILGGAGATVVAHVAVWVLGSLLFFLLLLLLRGSDAKAGDTSGAAMSGLALFCAFLSLIVAGPATLICLIIATQWLKRRDGFPATHLGALNTLWAVILVPLLSLWAISGDPAESVRAIALAGKAKEVERETALISAARKGDAETVRSLIRAGAVVNAKDDSGATALTVAASQGHTEIVRTLLQAGADANAKNDSGVTALMAPARDGYTEIVRSLIEAGADLNAKNDFGRTALMSAATNRHIEIVRALIEKGAEVNARDADGRTALMMAASADDPAMVRALLKAGADVKAKDNQGNSALQAAAGPNRAEIVRLLREAGARQ